MKANIYYMVKGILDEGGLSRGYNGEEREITPRMIRAYGTIRNLAKKYHRQAENECNGEGYIPRKGFFRLNSKAGYVSEDKSVFVAEMEKIEDKVKKLCLILGCVPEFQGDPRGWEISIKGNNFLSDWIYKK